MNGTAADILLADIGAWGLAAISGGIFLVHKALGRTRLVAPPKVPADQPAVPS